MVHERHCLSCSVSRGQACNSYSDSLHSDVLLPHLNAPLLHPACVPREQTVFGIERLVDLTIAKNIPWLAYVTTIVVRFGNNVFGGCISGLGSQRQAA